MSTAKEQPAEEQKIEEQTLNEDLASAWEAIESTETEVTDETTEEESAEASDEETTEAAEDETTETEEAAAEDEPSGEEETEPETAIEAPDHWSQEDRDAFAKLDNEGKHLLLSRHKSMEADYTRKTQEIAEIRKAIPDETKQQLSLKGQTEGQYIRSLAAADKYLTDNPVEGIQWLMKNYGVELDQLGGESEDSDPDISELKREVRDLRQQLQQRDQQTETARQSELDQSVQSFATETDENGHLKHPHFEQLKTAMAGLLQSGVANTLEDAYSQAEWADPKLRENLLSAQTKKARAEEEKRRKEHAKKAKKAATPKSSGTTATEKESMGLREELESAFDQTA